MNRALLLIFSITGFASTYSFAQTLRYETENKTDKLAPLKIGATISFASGLQQSGGLIVQGSIKRLFYHFEYRANFSKDISRVFYVDGDSQATTQPLKRGNAMEASVDFALVDKVKKGKIKVTTASGYGYEKYFHAECDARKIVAVSGGLFNTYYNYYLGVEDDNYFESNGLKLQPTGDKYYHAGILMTSFYGGLSFRKIKKAAVTSGGYRYRVTRATSWHLHVLTGTTKMDAIRVNNQDYTVTNVKSANLGYRIGWRADRGPTSSFVEIGYLPHLQFTSGSNHADMSLFGTQGISQGVNYFRLGFNFILFGNDRRYALKQ
ncbi:MAG: hypothetical protein GC181_02925 [Bacteroidetes bacterium]|nr:hypothetical protein [Bacteroidota bacterium]